MAKSLACFLIITGLCACTQASTSADAICGGTRAARADHAAALADTQDDRVLMTGARLIELVDAGCEK